MNVGDGICDEKKHTCKATGQEPGAISQASIPELPYDENSTVSVI